MAHCYRGRQAALAQSGESNPEREEGTVAPHIDAACRTIPRRHGRRRDAHCGAEQVGAGTAGAALGSVSDRLRGGARGDGQRSEVGRGAAILRHRFREEEHDCIERCRYPLHLLDSVGGLRRCRGEPHPDLHLCHSQQGGCEHCELGRAIRY